MYISTQRERSEPKFRKSRDPPPNWRRSALIITNSALRRRKVPKDITPLEGIFNISSHLFLDWSHIFDSTRSSVSALRSRAQRYVDIHTHIYTANYTLSLRARAADIARFMIRRNWFLCAGSGYLYERDLSRTAACAYFARARARLYNDTLRRFREYYIHTDIYHTRESVIQLSRVIGQLATRAILI